MLGLPSPPEGYMYGIDKYGNQTTILQKIFTEASGIVPANITGNISSAISNINMAQSAISSISTEGLSSFITSTLGGTSGLLNDAQNMLNQLPFAGDIKNIASQLLSTNNLLDTALTKLGSLKDFASGQLSGFIESCKWATTLAKGFVADAWESLNKSLSGVSDFVNEFVEDAASKLEEAMSNLGPSFEDTVNAVKDGSIFTEMKAKLGEMATLASILPDSMASGLGAAISDAAEKFSNSDFISEMKSIAETSGVTGIMDTINNAPNILSKGIQSLGESMADTAKEFGVPVDEISSAMADFKNEINDLTGIELDEFLSDPVNNAKNLAMNALQTGLDEVTQAVNTALAPALDSIEDAISDIKAKAFASQLASVNITPTSEAIAKTVNPAMYDKLNITVAINEESKKAKSEIKKEPVLAGLGKPQNYAPSTEPTVISQDRVYKQEVTDFLAVVTNVNNEVTRLRLKAEEETSDLMRDIDLRKEVIRRAESEGGYNLEKLQKYKEETQELVNELNTNPTYKQFRAKYEEYIMLNNAYERYVVGAYTSGSPRSTIPEEIRAKLSMETTYKSAN
jgi:hypothetical protein